MIGSSAAVRRFLRAGRGGAIVDVSSHQARRAVREALPYATAEAAVEGLTRATAVDHGPDGIRADAVAFLLSDAAFVSGAVLPVDGGRSAQGPDPEST